jgi:F420H(2)-dependent quinone reductase
MRSVAWTWQWAIWNQFTRAHVAAYRLTRGRFAGEYRGAPVLLLYHSGRKSGKERVSPLIYLSDGDDLVVVGSKGGSHKHPAWFLNLREMPETTVEIGGDRRRVTVRVATPTKGRGSGHSWSTSIPTTPPTRSARSGRSRS